MAKTNLSPPNTPETGPRRLRLGVECAALFIGVPAMVAAGWIHTWIIPLLVFMALGCGFMLSWRHHVRLSGLFLRPLPPSEWRRVLWTYALAAPGLLVLLWLLKPVLLFSLVRHHPAIWLAVMVLYPLVSVVPQELIYRAFFFERYRPLFGNGLGLPLASAVVFAFGHIVFHNWPAVVLTSLGGWLFGVTYRRTSSLLLVSVEHALYGCAIFTIGFGQYFFDGTLRLVRGG